MGAMTDARKGAPAGRAGATAAGGGAAASGAPGVPAGSSAAGAPGVPASAGSNVAGAPAGSGAAAAVAPAGSSAAASGSLASAAPASAPGLARRLGRAAAFAACVRAEFLKMRRAPIWLVFLLLPAVSAAIGTANYTMNLTSEGGVLTPGWENLWTQQTLFACYLFLPALIGVAASYLWRLEHQGSNWNELMCAPVSRVGIVCAKLVVCAACMLLAFASILVFYVVSGVALGIADPFPAGTIALYVALGWVGSLAIAAIQLVVSMLVRNFAVPVGIALAGGVVGLLAAMGGFANVFPYALMQTGMNSNTMVDLSAGTVANVVLMSLVWVVAAVAVATIYLRRSDIHAD